MQVEQFILDRIQRRQLKGHGQLLRMDDIYWLKKIYQCTLHGGRRNQELVWRSQGAAFMISRNMERIENCSLFIQIIIIIIGEEEGENEEK